MGFINNISRDDTTRTSSPASKIVNEIKVDVGVVETNVNSLPFDSTGVKVDKILIKTIL